MKPARAFNIKQPRVSRPWQSTSGTSRTSLHDLIYQPRSGSSWNSAAPISSSTSACKAILLKPSYKQQRVSRPWQSASGTSRTSLHDLIYQPRCGSSWSSAAPISSSTSAHKAKDLPSKPSQQMTASRSWQSAFKMSRTSLHNTKLSPLL